MDKNSQLLFDDMTLKELIGQSLKHWRKALAVGLVLALLLSGYTLISSYKNHPINMTTEEKAIYQAEVDACQKSVEMLSSQVAMQNEYIDKSVLMNINPNAVVNGSIVYYIQYADKNVAQSTDINYVYYTMVEAGEVAEYISNMEGFSSADYLTEVITASTSVEGGVSCLSVHVQHYDEQKVNIILDAITAVFQSKQAELQESVGGFTVKELSRSVFIASSTDLLEVQEEAYVALTTLQSTLAAKQGVLDELIKVVTVKNIILKTVLFFIGGFIAGFIAVIAVYAVMILGSSKVKSTNQLRSTYSIRVLGNFIFFDKKVRLLDKIAYKLSAERPDVPAEDVAKLVKSNIDAAEDSFDVLIVSLIDGEQADKVENLLKTANVSAKFIRTDFESAETIDAISSADSVVVLAKKFKSSIYQLDSAKNAIEDNNKKFLGVILV